MMKEFKHEIIIHKIPLTVRLFSDKWESGENDGEWKYDYTYYHYKGITYIAKEEIRSMNC